ncbi:hypothetical protein QQS21_008968 [Conoideocrella luteorostrata]|uniref:NmrA-like domain-containing protein n=1 Tax=Conoideocrella luteorostrata TaxID=1105319 RepID=A0AAJ0FY79_9HYPO|nr:hypothetical protein QQS21_008968 [Conoideocrella luteorostrata]
MAESRLGQRRRDNLLFKGGQSTLRRVMMVKSSTVNLFPECIMAETQLSILVLGGAGIQNSSVVRGISKNASFSIKVLSRDIDSDECQSLSTIPNVTIVQGDCYNEDVLVSNFKGVDACFVNTNGFAVGEKAEVYWGIRMYEIAYWAGVKHFVYSALPYVSKKSGFNPKYRVPFADGKGKVAEYLQSQPTDRMIWSILESGPYADSHLVSTWAPDQDADGTYVFRMPIGLDGAMAFVSLDDMGWYARYMFEHPVEFRGDLLSVGIEHADGETVAKAFTAVTSKPARFEPVDLLKLAASWPDKKIGLAGSPGYEDPTLLDQAGHFVPWFTIWSESGGNKGLWSRNYERLDRIHPGRIRSVEQWMRFVGFTGQKSGEALKTGLS